MGSTKRKKNYEKYKKFLKTNLLNTSEFEVESDPFKLKWNNKCTLETISYGHGISVTPLQAAATYAALTNGGNLIKPTILKKISIKS